MTFRNHVVTTLLALALGCQKLTPRVEKTPQTTPSSAASAPASSGGGLLAPGLSYPPGPWRKASPESLDRLVLWPSHLLIRYNGVKVAEDVAFKMADFHSVPAPPTRSRDEALALARQVAERARKKPERFAELVREHSEDLVRREQGGSLGGIPATQLSAWPEVLDALTALEPGGISDVVETWYGFHVFQRRAAPQPDTVTGRRIVIAHDQARFLSIVRGDAQPARTLSEALALAQRLYEQASASPEAFPELVERYSEHPDRIVGGDFGTWSNRELTPFPTEVEALDQLEIGQVAPPLDSLFGIEIVMRVPNPERAEYAFEGIQLDFDPAAPDGDAKSRTSVHAEARRLSEELRRDPSKLEGLSRQHARYHAQWRDGRGLPELSVAVREVAVGDVLREPPRSGALFLVGRRVSIRTKTPLAALSELPALGG